MKSVRVHIPATTANLGPGFDTLGLTLDLWNSTEFLLTASGLEIEITGEGADFLPRDESSLVYRAFIAACLEIDQPVPAGLRIHCSNAIPAGSGMGSSAAAVLAGILGAGALLEQPFTLPEALSLAQKIEGHADNAAAALLGGLIIAVQHEGELITRRFDIPQHPVVIILPDVDLPTRAARAALPTCIPIQDAVHNIGRTALVVEALRSNDWELLKVAMEDRLHQPYRFPLIPGAAAARKAALDAGAPACVLSGAGPSLIAFCQHDPINIALAMQSAFAASGIVAKYYFLVTTNLPARIDEHI
ncbi:MAG TPA: homoserine kinase [Anaerolineaceae bacterium]